jgi:L-lactate dehydrogenase complex protein LldG
MLTQSSRQLILQRISVAGGRKLLFDRSYKSTTGDIYKPILPDALTCFKNELEAINGHCFICENETDLYSKLKSFVQQTNLPFLYSRDPYITNTLKIFNIPFSMNETDFEGMNAGITGCEFLIARTGSVMVSSASVSGRQMNIFPPVHIVLAHVSQLVNYLEDALVAIHEKYGNSLPSSISTISGPSRTADIEKTLVLGAHGPKEFIVFLCKE